MLRNETRTGSGFSDVSVQVGILPTTPTRCMAASWGDFNNDMWPDLFVGYQEHQVPGEHSILYMNTNGHLYDETALRLGSTTSYDVNGVSWADMNNDGNMDIVTSHHFGYSAVTYGDGLGFCQNTEYISGYNDVGGHLVFDSELDGWNDLVYYPSVDAGHLVLLENNSQSGIVDFQDRTMEVGLHSAGKTGGAIAADFNGDGDSDLLFGRRAVQNSTELYGDLFFKAATAGEAYDDPAKNWISIRLSSPHGFNNTMGIGAKVSVFEGTNQYTKIGDGGHGRGESNGPDMLFGLGTATSVDSVVVVWPRGTRQVIDGSSVTIRQPLLIEDSTTLEILAPIGNYQIVPSTTFLDYTFAWKTTTWTTDSLDRVEVEGIGGCSPGLTTLTPNSADVEHNVIFAAGVYTHKMVWSNQPCDAGCNVLFRVTSEVDGIVSAQSDLVGVSIPVCGKKYNFHEE
jgi:ASPIC and UnbV/FG-GAP-like repeat